MRTAFASSNRLRTFFGYGNELSEAYKLVLDFFGIGYGSDMYAV